MNKRRVRAFFARVCGALRWALWLVALELWLIGYLFLSTRTAGRIFNF